MVHRQCESGRYIYLPHVDRSLVLQFSRPLVLTNFSKCDWQSPLLLLRFSTSGRFSTVLPCQRLSHFHCHTLQANNPLYTGNIAISEGAGDEARTRDVLLGKEVLYH